MAQETEFYKKSDVDYQLSSFLAGLEEHFFSLKLKDLENIPDYLNDLTYAYERIELRLRGVEVHKIWCE